MDYDSLETRDAAPVASSMIETFRAIGYSLETAIADIIDNSVSAEATKIKISQDWRGGQSIISIEDDGRGMNNDELVAAMCPGLRNPNVERNPKDLGRFGLGLKTASFSQCRKLSVISKKKGYVPVYWSWDLDYVAETNKWNLIKWIPQEFLHALDDKESGTIVIWSDLDRIIPSSTKVNDEKMHESFLASMNRVKQHIAMTFHKFIENGTIVLVWGDNPIEPWNPFCRKERATQELSTDTIMGYSSATMKGCVLPHKNNFSSQEAYEKAEGAKGWPAQQGFYIYRGNRLLLAGDWLGLYRKEEHYKLVRIEINLPNTMDFDWRIDIKKSRAYPPPQCVEQLRKYSEMVRRIGCEVYRHRGKIIKHKAGASFQPLWLEKKKDDKWFYVINREHDMITSIKSMAKEKPDQAINTLLSFIEECIPTESIYIKKAQNGEQQKNPCDGMDIEVVKRMMMTIYKNKVSEGFSDLQAKTYLKSIEPFNNFEELVDEL